MPHRFILPGTTFGLLRVVNQEGHTPAGERLYRCTCACGKRRLIRTSILRAQKYYSCGCFRHRHPALRNNNKKAGAPFEGRNKMMLFLSRMGEKKTVIARKFGISPSTVNSKLRRMELAVRDAR